MADQGGSLLDQFIQEYDISKTETGGGPDPDPDKLVDVEDHLSDTVSVLTLMELTEEERKNLKGKRSPDLLDIMIETAEGLHDCEQIREAVKTEPELFERMAALDLGMGSVVSILQTLYVGADTALLLRSGEADALLDDAEAAFKAAQDSPALAPERAGSIEGRLAELLRRRREAEQRGEAATQANRDALRPLQDQLDAGTQQADTSALVRQLLEDAFGTTPAAGQPAVTAAGHAGKPKGPADGKGAGKHTTGKGGQ